MGPVAAGHFRRFEKLNLFADVSEEFQHAQNKPLDDQLKITNYVFSNTGHLYSRPIEAKVIFIEKMILDTPDLKTERLINEFVDIDVLSKTRNLYFKRVVPFEKISGASIPLTVKFFTLKIEYRLDDGTTKQKSIRFDNTTFLAPVL